MNELTPLRSKIYLGGESDTEVVAEDDMETIYSTPKHDGYNSVERIRDSLVEELMIRRRASRIRILKMLIASLLIVVYLFVGAVIIMEIEKWSNDNAAGEWTYVNAVYFVTVTLTTIGTYNADF